MTPDIPNNLIFKALLPEKILSSKASIPSVAADARMRRPEIRQLLKGVSSAI
jgi:hypothetical protein